MGVNYAAIPVRPAGAGWSSVNDMLRYVAMELASGRLPDGERGLEFVVREGEERTLIMRDAQHEYVFEAI